MNDSNKDNALTLILTATLVGGAAGFIDFATGFETINTFPIPSQINFFLLNWLTGIGLGAVVGIGLVCVHKILPEAITQFMPSAPAKVLAVYTFLVTIPSDLGLGGIAMAACASIVVGLGVMTVAKLIPVLDRGYTWAWISGVTFIAAVAMIGSTSPTAHGVPYLALALATIPIVVTALAVALMRTDAIVMPAIAVATLLFALVATPFSIRPQAAAVASAGPNVVLISIDTLRSDHIGCYGNTVVKTPHIDALAEAGVLFEQAISPFPLTNPSHSSMLTGLYPGNHGVDQNRPLPFKEGVESLPDVLAQSGYRTAGFVSGYTLEKNLSQLYREFDAYDDALGRLGPATNRWRENRIARILFKVGERAGFIAPRSIERQGGPTTDAALSWMADNADTPFFLFLHMYDPHGSYEPPPPYDTMYTDYTGSATGDWYGLSEIERTATINDEAALEHIRNLYKGEVTYSDAQVGRVVAQLEELGIDENTLLIVTSDHGESLGAHDYYFDHGRCLYDDLVRVPLVIRFPEGEAAGTRVADQVRLFDIVPTVLGYLGKEPFELTDGFSLMGFVDGETPLPDPNPVFSMAGQTHGTERLMSIRTPEYKLIRNDGRWLGSRLQPSTDEFYRLESDPFERENIIDEPLSEIAVYQEALQSSWNRWFEGGSQSASPSIDSDTQDALESLGYL